jgi:hypothetical protein
LGVNVHDKEPCAAIRILPAEMPRISLLMTFALNFQLIPTWKQLSQKHELASIQLSDAAKVEATKN